MFNISRKPLILFMVLSLTIFPFASTALAQEYFESEDPSGGAMIFDLAAVRPIGIIATAIGSVFFVLSSPFSALGDNIDTAGEKLVKEPFQFTFKRPLGEF